MKKLIGLVAVVSLVLPFVPRTAFAGKPLPPAFGKELVPDESTQRNEEKAAEMEEEKVQQRKRPPVKLAPQKMRGKKLHIELDGDEDGGGIDDDSDDGAEF